jgi:hypothetical protein
MSRCARGGVMLPEIWWEMMKECRDRYEGNESCLRDRRDGGEVSTFYRRNARLRCKCCLGMGEPDALQVTMRRQLGGRVPTTKYGIHQ